MNKIETMHDAAITADIEDNLRRQGYVVAVSLDCNRIETKEIVKLLRSRLNNKGISYKFVSCGSHESLWVESSNLKSVSSMSQSINEKLKEIFERGEKNLIDPENPLYKDQELKSLFADGFLVTAVLPNGKKNVFREMQRQRHRHEGDHFVFFDLKDGFCVLLECASRMGPRLKAGEISDKINDLLELLNSRKQAAPDRG
jgi:hypothetical protein